jgi:DNA-binding CsgD family transcriptional regulator
VSAELEILPLRSRGRPSLYDSAYCERALELASQGCGKAEIAAALGVSRKTLNAWIKMHADFRETMDRAKEAEFAWWLAIGRTKQFDKNWNAASWNLQMRNRFSDRFSGGAKKPAKEKRKDPLNAERLRAEMERKLSRIADSGPEEEVSREPDAL